MSSGVAVSSGVVENVVIRNFYYIKKGSFVKQPDLSPYMATIFFRRYC